MLCTQHPGGSTEDELVEALVERGVRGIVFLSGLHADVTADPERYARLLGQGVPYVLVNGFNPAIAGPYISPDERASARIAVQHLVELGHQRIGLAVGPNRFVPVHRKVEGFVEALGGLLGLGEEQAGEYVRHTLFSVEGGHAAAGALLDKGCTGIVCGSDLMALGAVRAVRERGLTVPGDVSVVGYDDSPLIAFTDPPLTTVRQPVEAMGAAAVNALLEEIGGNPVQRSEFVFQTELVVRGSTGQAPGGRGVPEGLPDGGARRASRVPRADAEAGPGPAPGGAQRGGFFGPGPAPVPGARSGRPGAWDPPSGADPRPTEPGRRGT